MSLSPFGYFRFFFPCYFKYNTARINNKINNLYKILYLIFDYPHKHYTFKHFEI